MQFKLMHSQALSLLLIACLCALATGRPSDEAEATNADSYENEYNGQLSAETIRKIQQCDLNMEVMELCMRCAKVTKSQIVYPLCCANEDEIQSWCKSYIFFGVGS